MYYVVNQGPINSIPNQNPTPYVPPGSGSNTYMVTLATTWTSNADGTTVITPLSISGGSLAGFDILQIELEIKPLIPEGQVGAQYVWNKSQGILTLVNNTYADQGQTLSILYTKLV